MAKNLPTAKSAERRTSDAARRRSKKRQEQLTATLARIDRLKPPTPQAASAIAMLRSWLTDESDYDDKTWPQLKRALNRERDRVGARRLFDD
jgi:hypothetical protein